MCPHETLSYGVFEGADFKIAENTTSLQRFTPKKLKIKMSDRNHCMIHKSAAYAVYQLL